jgi:hypothetical protein
VLVVDLVIGVGEVVVIGICVAVCVGVRVVVCVIVVFDLVVNLVVDVTARRAVPSRWDCSKDNKLTIHEPAKQTIYGMERSARGC